MTPLVAQVVSSHSGFKTWTKNLEILIQAPETLKLSTVRR